jgi:cellulose synthase/poly-beta-1,6-N-acetylglucosamine synthase-like glycosyltransferase
MTQTVNVVIPMYNERPEDLGATLMACRQQTHPIARIYVVDDGRTRPVALPKIPRTL